MRVTCRAKVSLNRPEIRLQRDYAAPLKGVFPSRSTLTATPSCYDRVISIRILSRALIKRRAKWRETTRAYTSGERTRSTSQSTPPCGGCIIFSNGVARGCNCWRARLEPRPSSRYKRREIYRRLISRPRRLCRMLEPAGRGRGAESNRWNFMGGFERINDCGSAGQRKERPRGKRERSRREERRDLSANSSKERHFGAFPFPEDGNAMNDLLVEHSSRVFFSSPFGNRNNRVPQRNDDYRAQRAV